MPNPAVTVDAQKKSRRRAVSVFAITMLGLALWLLYRELGQYAWEDLATSVRAIPSHLLGWAIVLTAANYAVLSGYDLLATRSIGRPLPWSRVVLGSFIGYAVAHNFGSVLGGPAARFRIYSMWGLSPFEIVKLIAMLALTFWVGLFAIAGLVLLFDPPPIPARLQISTITLRPLGAIFLSFVALYMLLGIFHHAPMHWGKRELSFPRWRFSVAQIVVVAIDLTTAASVLYVLLPSETTPSFPQFLAVYLVAVLAGYFTQAPGGLGVFELSVLVLLDASDAVTVAGPLLAFRMIYYVVPLLAAAMIWAVIESMNLRRNGQGGE